MQVPVDMPALPIVGGVSSAIVLGAIIVGWFAPNDRYEVLALLLTVVVGVLGLLFSWLVRLQREVDANTKHRVEARELALAFHDPQYDYEQDDWLRTTDDVNRPTASEPLLPLSSPPASA